MSIPHWLNTFDSNINAPKTCNSPITFVSAYWEIKSKHTNYEYKQWMAPLSQLHTPTIIFSDVYSEHGVCTHVVNRTRTCLEKVRKITTGTRAKRSRNKES